MDARAVETGLDEIFPDASQLTLEEAKALGVVRGMLWKIEEADRVSMQRLFTGRTA